MKTDRLPDGVPSGFLELAPDLAIEVVSSSATAAAVHQKTLEYLACGATLVWTVYPETRSVAVHTWSGESELLTEPAALIGEPMLPGFELPLERLFRGLDG